MTDVVWYVQGDGNNLLWKTKMDAEMYARELFPDEPAHYRYARIMYTEVHSYE